MTTYLNVPFRDKAEAKARGARWDSAARKWFVPVGRDLAPFAGWLPVDPARLADPAGVDEPSKGGVSLSQLLGGVATAVEQVFRQGVWTIAEVMRVDGESHVYLELAERDAVGALVAKARAIVWARDVEQVLGTFQAATGVRLAAGVKVLVRARPEFSAQYGLTLHVDAIDPSYTLGDLEAQKSRIRERLKAEGVFERNRQLPPAFDYRALLVVSPPRAAGLGDFARDADRLQRFGLCEVVYVHSRFEGEGAPAGIRQAIEAALVAWAGPALPEAIVVIRGGGAVNDLAWLNDYELTRYVCLSAIPVLTGIGHERDSTLLDEVAHRRFDTPSKVIAGIEALIVKRVRESQSAFDEIAGLTLRHLRTARADVEALDAAVRRQAASTLVGAREGTRGSFDGIERQARRVLGDARESGSRALAEVRARAAGRLAASRATAAGLIVQVQSDVGRGVQDARRRADELCRDVRAHALDAVGHRKERIRSLRNAVAADARRSLRQGTDAAEASFREVISQGPDKTLGRGFAIVQTAGGQLVTDAGSAGRAGVLRVRFRDGSVEAAVSRRRKKKTP